MHTSYRYIVFLCSSFAILIFSNHTSLTSQHYDRDASNLRTTQTETSPEHALWRPKYTFTSHAHGTSIRHLATTDATIVMAGETYGDIVTEFDPSVEKTIAHITTLSAPTKALVILNQTLIALASGTRIALWDRRSRSHIRTLTGHTTPITALTSASKHFSSTFCSGDEQGTIRIWDMKIMKCISRMYTKEPITALEHAYESDAKNYYDDYVITGHTKGSVRAGFLPQWPENIYRSQKSKSSRKRHLDPVIALEHIGNRRTLATYARGFVRLMTGNTCINTHEAPWRDEHATDNFRASTLISNHCIASAGAHYIDIWNYDINEHTEIRNPHQAPITALAGPCDDAMISAAYGDPMLQFWEKGSHHEMESNPDVSTLRYPRPQRIQKPSCLNG